MSTPSPIEVAAIPSLIGALTAVKAFIGSLGTDPMQVPIKFPGAVQVLLGTLELQLPVLAQAEFGAVVSEAGSKIDSVIAALQAKLPK
jgi:hypothetical protein